MSEFIFRFPQDTPEMTFEALTARLRAVCDRERCTSCTDKIGTTVTLRWHTRDRSAVQVRLYEFTVAIIGHDAVRFPNDDPHRATTEWIARIVKDNGIGSGVWRIRRHAADGPGPATSRGYAGLLVIDGDRARPVHDRAWPVNYERIAANRDWRERWAADMAFRSQDPDQWEADLAAARPANGGPSQGMPDYRDRVDARYWQGSRHQPDLSDIR